MQNKTYKRYLRTIITVMMVLLIPLLANVLFLANHHELDSMEQVVDKQLSSPTKTLAGMVIQNQGYDYKKQLVLNTQPDILVLGSSRTLQFREAFFEKTMVTAGGAVASIPDCYHFLDEMLAHYQPKFILIGIDYWWFHNDMVHPRPLHQTTPHKPNQITLRSFLQPFVWLSQGKTTFQYYLAHLNPLKVLKPSSQFGLDGMLYHTGFASDGSYYYTKTVVGEVASHDAEFSTTLGMLQQQEAVFAQAQHIDIIHLENLELLIEKLNTSNIPYLVFFPPNAQTLVNKMNENPNGYAYIDLIKAKLDALRVEYYDYLSPDSFGSSDCEFIDGIHGGDLAYAKMLVKLSQDSSSRILKDNLNLSLLNDTLTHFDQVAMLPNRDITTKHEIDFLKLGCQKS